MGHVKCVTLCALIFQGGLAKGRAKKCPQTQCGKSPFPEGHQQAVFLGLVLPQVQKTAGRASESTGSTHIPAASQPRLQR